MYLYEIAFAIGAGVAARRRDLASLGLLGWAVAPLLLFATRPFSKYFDIRFLASSLPVFFLLAGAGIAAVARGAAAIAARLSGNGACAARRRDRRRRSRRTRVRHSRDAALLGVFACSTAAAATS